jgi:hypothetical protein
MSDWEVVKRPQKENVWEVASQPDSSTTGEISNNFDYSRGQNEAMNPFAAALAKHTVKHPMLSKGIRGLAEYAAPVNEFIESALLPDISRGFLQGIGNTGISIANMPASLIDKLTGLNTKTPHLDLSAYSSGRPGAEYAADVGEFGGKLIPGMGLVGALNKLGRPGGYAGIGSDILKGAGAGYALGEDEEGNRGLASAFGGILGGIQGVSSKAIANRFSKDRSNIKTKYNKTYENILSQGEKAGVKRVPVPEEHNLGYILRGADRKMTIPIEKYFQHPTLRNAQSAQSAAGKIASKIERSARNRPEGFLDVESKAIDASKDLQRKIRSGIVDQLDKSSKPALGKKYLKTTEGYGRDVVPYDNSAAYDYSDALKIFKKSKHGKLGPAEKKLVDSLRGDVEFQAAYGNLYPELGINKFTRNLTLPRAVGLGITGGAGYAGRHELKDFLKRNF